MILADSPKKFSIAYDAATNTIYITSGGAYQPIGDELIDMLTGDFKTLASPQRLVVDNIEVSVAAYNIDGYNYFRLRDLAILLNFAVEFDDAEGKITFDFTKPYDGE